MLEVSLSILLSRENKTIKVIYVVTIFKGFV